MKSPNFWYPDGNVVIKGDATYHQLHSSRLVRYCVYFKKLFTDDANDYEDQCTTVDGCPIYHIPTDLDSDDFDNLLAVLETPLCAADADRRTVPGSRHAQPLVQRRTQTRDEAPLRHLGRRPSSEGILAPRNPRHPIQDEPRLFSGGRSQYPDSAHAVFIILFARQYGISALLKRAFYELLASTDFWAALTADHKQMRLTEDDLLRLYNARHVLQQRWREAVVLAPYTNEQGVSACRVDVHGMGMMLESGLVEAGTADPMRFDVLGALTQEQRQPWCPNAVGGVFNAIQEVDVV
ncbi:hypothetical protein VTO73DRAFT_13801 [Trametes versicolor]